MTLFMLFTLIIVGAFLVCVAIEVILILRLFGRSGGGP